MKDTCNLCDSREFELLKSELRDEKTGFKVFRCRNCNHVQLLPRPAEGEDREFYNKNMQDKNRQKEIDYEKLRINNKCDTARRVKLIKELFQNNTCSILDVGAGYGFFVNELYNSGYKNVTGIEISDERRNIANNHSSVQIMNFDVNNPDRNIGRFDVVTVFHILEHMSNPIMFLTKIRNLVNSRGTLICEVPNVREALLDNCKEYNNFYWIRAHVNYFSRETLLDCLKKALYENVETRFEQRYGLINFCNWLTAGKPQIEMPIFDICDAYKPVEDFYRNYVKSNGRSDTLLAIARL